MPHYECCYFHPRKREYHENPFTDPARCSETPSGKVSTYYFGVNITLYSSNAPVYVDYCTSRFLLCLVVYLRVTIIPMWIIDKNDKKSSKNRLSIQVIHYWRLYPSVYDVEVVCCWCWYKIRGTKLALETCTSVVLDVRSLSSIGANTPENKKNVLAVCFDSKVTAR